SLESNGERRKYLEKAIDFPMFLGIREQEVAKIGDSNIKIRLGSFPAKGSVEEKDKQLIINLNEKLLGKPQDLLDTYVHELGHFLSGRGDYILDFNRFLMAIATSRLPLT